MIIVIEKLFYENILLYVMIGIFVFGILLKIMLNIGYSRMIRATNNMGQTKNKLLRKLKLKFETFFKLDINVNSVDTFVDKSINNHKVFGILLISWEKLSGQLSIVCGLISVISALLGLFMGIDNVWILGVFSAGLISCGLLILFENLLNKKEKKEIIRINILDYLGNYLKNRLEQEVKDPELLEGYKNYFSDDVMKGNSVINFAAVGNEAIQIASGEGIEFFSEKPTLKEKWIKSREKRKRKKEEKKATKLFEKQVKKAAKEKLKEDKQKSIREEQRAKEQAKILKQKEKQKEEEIKKALKLEKQMSLLNEQSQERTTAEQNKESLKKEIEESRKRESVEQENENQEQKSNEEKNVENIRGKSDQNIIKNIEIDFSNDTYKYDQEVAATNENSTISNEKIGQLNNPYRKDEKDKVKKYVKLSKQDEKVIKDVLREYLG